MKKQKNKILLVHPTPKLNNWKLYQEKSRISFSLSIETLAAATPDDFEVILLRENIEKIDFDYDADLIGITALTYIVNDAYKIAQEFKKRGKTVVMGGYHASFMPNEAKKYVDCVVVGEADNIWPKLLNDFKGGELKEFYYSKEPVDLNNLPFPKTDLSKYGTLDSLFPIQASRGCPYKCQYCSISYFHKQQIKFRPVEKVIEELKRQGHKYVVFIDDNLFIDYNFTKELFTALKPLNIRWCTQMPVTIAEHEELLKLARDSGCFSFWIGLESVNQKSLNSVNKSFNQVEKYKQAIKKIKEYKIGVVLYLMFGFDNDTKQTLNDTLKFIRDVKPLYVQFGLLTPYPGTEMHDQLKQKNRIIDTNWDHYHTGPPAVYKPTNMTTKALEECYIKFMKKYNSPIEVLRRLLFAGRNNYFLNCYYILVAVPYLNYLICPAIVRIFSITDKIKKFSLFKKLPEKI